VLEKKHFICFIVMVLCGQSIVAQTAIPPAAGDGSQANPYQVATLENLYWIASDATRWKSFYAQTADINASETLTWFGGQGWIPIGSSNGHPFLGSYDGHGHSIDSLYINRPAMSGVGLFGFGGIIANLGVTHVNITGGDQVGGLLGFNLGGGSVKNCYSSGILSVVNSKEGIGGLVGINQGTVTNSYSSATVNGGFASGGLAGSCVYGTIYNCYSVGQVNGGNAGGLVGTCYYSLIINCYAAGRVQGSGSVGGLFGFKLSTSVFGSFWDVDSSGQTTSAAGNGKTTTQLRDPALFVNSPWDSAVWNMDANINLGHPYLSWQNPGGTPLPAGHIVAPNAGDGSNTNPYRIATLENLYWLAKNPGRWLGSYFIQVADINASRTREYGEGEGWVPIGISADFSFHGFYNGSGHTIDSLYINSLGSECLGLFGLSSYGQFESLGLTNEEFSGGGGVGGVIGVLLGGLITDCYSSGIVKGTGSDIGGIVGYTAWGGVINCFSSGRVEGTASNVGGIAGQLSTGSQLSNCYSKANVFGANDIGGLSGFVHPLASIDHSYAVGAVAGTGTVGGLAGGTNAAIDLNGGLNITSCFWNTESSHQDSSYGGSGRTTLQMITPATFSHAGWSGTFWHMDSEYNNGYPYLTWQNPNGTPLPLLPWLSGPAMSISFGLVPLHIPKEQGVLITNTGTDTLRITSVISTNHNFVLAPATSEIAPSENFSLSVTFTPEDTSAQTGLIILATNTSNSPDTLVVSGRGTTLTEVRNGPRVPLAFSIDQNYPNPFNPTTLIQYDIPRTAPVLIRVYDLLGREAARLVDEVQRPGSYTVRYDGTNTPSGIYFYTIHAGDFHQVRKMLLIK
jgi:hypothetical protein